MFIFTFKVPWKNQNVKLYNSLPVPTVVETAIKGLPLQIIYVFN